MPAQICARISRPIPVLCARRGCPRCCSSSARLNAVYGYQILSGKRHPGRESLLCLCFGLGLDAEQTQKLLLHAGCAQLYIKKPRESIIFYALNAGLPLPSCNQLLYEHGEAILGWA